MLDVVCREEDDCVAAIRDRQIYCEVLKIVVSDYTVLIYMKQPTWFGLSKECRQVGCWVRHEGCETARVSAAGQLFFVSSCSFW